MLRIFWLKIITQKLCIDSKTGSGNGMEVNRNLAKYRSKICLKYTFKPEQLLYVSRISFERERSSGSFTDDNLFVETYLPKSKTSKAQMNIC